MDTTSGESEAKRRVRLILLTLTEQMSIAEACRQLDIGKSHFANLRQRMLQGAVDAMAPDPIGRPQKAPVIGPDAHELEDEILELEHENTLLRAKVEVDEALRAAQAAKENGPKKARKRPRRSR